MAHHGAGIVLKTTFDERENKVLRTIFEQRCVHYQTISDYVPPLFLVVNYEEASFTRSCFFKRPTTAKTFRIDDDDGGGGDDDDKNDNATGDERGNKNRFGGNVKTDELLQENMKFVESLLVSADCNYEAFQYTFLRLETVGDYQRHFEELYPLWNVGVGTFARLTFTSWQTRSRALATLAYNAANNRDVFTINYAANVSPVTIVDYLEPLFAYCAKACSLDADRLPYNTIATPTDRRLYSGSGCGGGAGKRSSLAAATNTSEMFEIEFCVVDDPIDVGLSGGQRGAGGGGGGAGSLHGDRESSYSHSHSSTAFSGVSVSTASKRSTFRRKRGTLGSDAGSGCTINATHDTDGGNTSSGRKRRLLKQALVLEKPRTMCGSLSVHDVRPYFSMLHTRRLSRPSLDQLEELPVVVVRCERDFCATTCCVVNRTDKQSTVMHVYYCWNKDVYDLLSSFADVCRKREQNDRLLVAVEDLCSEDIEARLRMLTDLKNVIWKENMNAYVRLAVGETHDKDMLARGFYEPLVFHLQRHSADLETEIRCSVQSSRVCGSTDVFRSAITLDCERLCSQLDTSDCRFARAYRDLVESPAVCCNGYVRLVNQRQQRMGGDQGGSEASALYRLLGHRQDLYARLVSEFRSERVLETAYDVASELRLGLLDTFGLTYTDDRQQQRQRRRHQGRRQADPKKNATATDLVFDSVRVSNYVFLETLTDSSLFFGSTGSQAACLDFFDKDDKDKNVKPVEQYARGLYRHNMMEVDLKSAFPSVAALYNISPETTAIVQRNRLRELDEALEAFLNTDCRHDDDKQNTRVDDAKRNAVAARTMKSFYHQICHVNDTCSGLVVVSLRPEFYVGFLALVMEKLVLKRNTQNALMNPFYKKLANFALGCTGQVMNSNASSNDLFSPQCMIAIGSLNKIVMLSVMQNLPTESVVMAKTDSVVLYAGSTENDVSNDVTMSCKHFEDTVHDSINGIVTDVGNLNTRVGIVPRIRSVDLCLVIDQNRYLMLYTDGKTVSKGQLRQQHGSGSGITALVADSLLAHIATYVRDKFDPRHGERVATELNRFLNSCFDHIDSLDVRHTVADWFFFRIVPTTKGAFTDGKDRTRFGDKVAVWPVLVHNDNQVFDEQRVIRPLYNTAVRPNSVFVVKDFLHYWVKWLFTISFPDQDEEKLMKMYYAVCKKRERL